MEKGQKQTRKTAKCGRRNSNRMPTNQNRNQLIDAAEIKQEPDIKVEPQPIGDLVTVSAQLLDNRNDKQVLMESDSEEEHVNCSSDDDVNVEVKDECEKSEKKEKEDDPELNVFDGDEANGRQDQHPSNADENDLQTNEIGNGAHNAKEPKKTKAKGSALKPHKCTQCEYAATCKSLLERHLLKHTGEKPFECKHCSKSFTQKQYLQNHMKVHVKDFLFNCSVCLRGFDRKNEKTDHEDNCKALRYECHLCKKSFGTNKGHSIVHMRVHSGERAFECKECSKQFTMGHHLKRHMKQHTGPRPFRCSKCLHLFANQNERNEHESKCNRRTFDCYACDKSFGSNKVNLDRHIRTHTGEKSFECTKCPKKFTQKSNLNNHQKIHSRSLPWKCAICHQGFAKPAQHKAHQRSCSRRGYECFLCRKFIGPNYTTLKRHMLTHSGEKPFKCQICQNRFTLKGSLGKHIKSIHNNQP